MTLALDDATLLPVVRRALGRPAARLGPWAARPCPVPVENFTTEALQEVQGELADGTPWTLFLKALHPASASPRWRSIPEAARADVLHELDWRDEPRVYRSALGLDLPPGLRLPRLLGVEESEDLLLLWLERVDAADCWDAAAYGQAARLLGRLSGRWPEDRARRELGLRRRDLAAVLEGPVRQAVLPVLAEDATWAQPALADQEHLRDDLAQLAVAAGGLVDRVRELPHGLAHGDACPANLLWQADGSLVAVDWSYGSTAPFGADLGQLLAGRALSGALDPADLPALVDVVQAGYLAGLGDEGAAADPDAVALALAVDLLVRSGFWALVPDRPDLDPDARQHLLRRRAGLSRVAADLALGRLSEDGPDRGGVRTRGRGRSGALTPIRTTEVP